jgi:hypothetical protein
VAAVPTPPVTPAVDLAKQASEAALFEEIIPSSVNVSDPNLIAFISATVQAALASYQAAAQAAPSTASKVL